MCLSLHQESAGLAIFVRSRYPPNVTSTLNCRQLGDKIENLRAHELNQKCARCVARFLHNSEKKSA
jgi:hypothetical protein